jgi:hypothetical protein
VKDLTTRRATGIKGGLLPAVNQVTSVPAVQMCRDDDEWVSDFLTL